MRFERLRPRSFPLLLLALCAPAAAQSRSAVELHPIALVGDQAPGVGTAFVGFESPFGTVQGAAPTLDSAGNAGLFATVVDPEDPTQVRSGIWKEVDGRLALVALSRMAAPGTLEDFVAFPHPLFEVPPEIARGLTCVSASTPSVEQGIWSERGGALERIVLHGEALPGGPAGETFHSPIGRLFENGSVLVESRWSTWRGDEGFWRDATGSLELLVRAGLQAPGMTAGVVFEDADSLHLQGPFDRWDATGDGRIVFNGTVQGPGIDRTNDEAIWRESLTGGLELLLAEGEDAPALGASFRFGVRSGVRAFGGSEHAAIRTNDRGTLLFGASAHGGPFDYVGVLWRRFADGTLEVVAAEEEPWSGFPGTIQPGTGAPFQRIFLHASLNDQDRVAFQDVIPHELNTFYNSETAIFWDQPGELALLVATETRIPGLHPGELVDGLALGELLDDGSLYATATLKNGPRGPERALLLFEPDGTAHVLVREGAVVDATGSGELRTIAEFGVRGSKQGPRFGLLLVFTDGTSGVYRLELVERAGPRRARVPGPPRDAR